MEQHTAGTGGNLPEKRKIDCESSDSGYVNSPSKIAKIESKTPGSPASLGGPGLARRTLSSDNLAVMCGGVGGVGGAGPGGGRDLPRPEARGKARA